MASEFTSTAFYNKLKEEKKLIGVKCQDCGHLSPEPRPMCPECHGFNMEWHEFSGKAKLSTFTCIFIVPVKMAAKGYGRDKPYCTGIVTGMDMVLDVDDIDEKSPALAFKAA